MHSRLPLAIPAAAGLAAAGVAAPAAAQSFTNDSHITFPLSWSEVNSAGQPITGPGANGILEPGEYGLITVGLPSTGGVSFSNQNQIANFSPAIGTFTSGTIFGFGSGFFDLVGQPGPSGTQGFFNNNNPPANGTGTTGYGVRGQWRLVDNGTINPGSDGIINIQPGQFPVQQPSSANPITNLFRALWQPSSFSPRTVNFHVAGSAPAGNTIAALYLQLGSSGNIGAAVYVNPETGITFGSITIPIVPAPPGLALLALAGPAATRRRRADPFRKEKEQ